MIASKAQHRARTSLLGGETSYEPLHSNSFSIQGHGAVVERDEYFGYNDRQYQIPSPKHRAKKLYIPRTKWTIAFSAVVFLQALIALGLEAYVFGKFETALRGDAKSTSLAQTIPTYLTLFIFGFLYELGLTYDALRNRNTIQIIGLCIYNCGMLIYAAIEMGQVSDAVGTLTAGNEIQLGVWKSLYPSLIAAPCVIALGSAMMSFVAWKLYQEFAWDIYKSVSADLQMRHRLLTYQIYIALLKFDFFFFLGFSVQFLVIVGNNFTGVEVGLTIAALPVTVVLLFLAAFFCRRETRIGQSFIILIYFGAMAYFVFKLVRMYDMDDPGKVLEYLPARKTLTTFAIITLILLVITIGTAFLCMHNFGRGLKPYITTQERSADASKLPYGETAYSQRLEQVPERMVID